MDKQQGPTVEHMEPCSMLCGSLDERGVWWRMDTCLCMGEFHCCPPEIITTLLIGHSVQFSHAVMSDSLWPPWTAAHQDSLSITNPQSLLKLMSIESVMPSNYLIHVIPFSSHLQSFPASGSFPMSQCFTSSAKVLEPKDQSFQWIFRTDFL